MFTPKELSLIIDTLEGHAIEAGEHERLLKTARSLHWAATHKLSNSDERKVLATIGTEKHAVYGWTLAAKIAVERESRVKDPAALAKDGEELLAALGLG